MQGSAAQREIGKHGLFAFSNIPTFSTPREKHAVTGLVTEERFTLRELLRQGQSACSVITQGGAAHLSNQ
jgi:hypothetical protein